MTHWSAWTLRSSNNSAARQNRIAALVTGVVRHDPRRKLAHRARASRRLTRAPQPLPGAARRIFVRAAWLARRSPSFAFAIGGARSRLCAGSLEPTARSFVPQRKSALGDQLTTRLADGSFSSRVETVTPGASAATPNLANEARDRQNDLQRSTQTLWHRRHSRRCGRVPTRSERRFIA